MQNINLEIKKSSKASAFTLIVAFVCVALVGLALVPFASGQTEPLTDITRLHGAFQYARHFGTRGGNDSYQQTGGDACPCQGNTKHIFDFRQWLGKYKCESGQACRCGCRTF